MTRTLYMPSTVTPSASTSEKPDTWLKLTWVLERNDSYSYSQHPTSTFTRCIQGLAIEQRLLDTWSKPAVLWICRRTCGNYITAEQALTLVAQFSSLRSGVCIKSSVAGSVRVYL